MHTVNTQTHAHMHTRTHHINNAYPTAYYYNKNKAGT